MSNNLPADPHAAHMAKINPIVDALRTAINEASLAALHQDGPLMLAIAMRKVDTIFAQLNTHLQVFSTHYANLETTNETLWRQRDELQDKYNTLKSLLI